MPPYAHTREGASKDEWEDLKKHLESVAKLAETFAVSFAPGWGRVSGLWHDLGKYQPQFQKMLEQSGESGGYTDDKVEHSIVGALYAFQQLGGLGKPLSLCIAAHHGDLKDWQYLKGRFETEKIQQLLAAAIGAQPPESILKCQKPSIPNSFKSKESLAMWVRFLFSALVDADSLQTEAWDKGEERAALPHTLDGLATRLDDFLERKRSESGESEINELRSDVLRCCLDSASKASGQFTLTVPTGGGKTYSALAFALHHARNHGHRRVITVLPYTTILEQTVKAYRDAVGTDAVVEHHSNIDITRESLANQHATENWDAPLVVTTSVQFLESLYANHKRRCRKLHNIANSIVILDEVQTFPLGLIAPIQSALRILAEEYGVTIVYCTATQPQLANVRGAIEIIPEPANLFKRVEGRYRTIWPTVGMSHENSGWDVARLHQEISAETESTLVIVHRRNEAQELAECWGDSVIHLSARMCALHRRAVVARIKRDLKLGHRIRVVATQLVEAGVDIDFPVVYRALAGLDTLAQAAGRCNREGRLAIGKFVVYEAASEPPAVALRKGLDVTKLFLKERLSVDLADPMLFPEYFRVLTQRIENADVEGILALEKNQDFPETAKKFKLIEEAGQPVIAPYCRGAKRLVDELKFAGPNRRTLRALQPHLVNLYPQEIRRLQADGAIRLAHRDIDRLWVVSDGMDNLVYSDRFGFSWAAKDAEPPTLIA